MATAGPAEPAGSYALKLLALARPLERVDRMNLVDQGFDAGNQAIQLLPLSIGRNGAAGLYSGEPPATHIAGPHEDIHVASGDTRLLSECRYLSSNGQDTGARDDLWTLAEEHELDIAGIV